MRIRVERLVLVSLLAIPLVAAYAPGSALAGTIDPKWGWVVDLQPTQAVVTNLGPQLQGNSFNATNSVNRMGVGWYRVTMPYMGAPYGNVLVSAISTTFHNCIADTWANQSSGTFDELIDIRCYDQNGSPINSKFVVNWISASDIGGKLGYGTDQHPTSCGVQAQNAYDTYGGTVTVCPLQSTGKRFASEMTYPHLGSNGGTVQITAMTRNANDNGASISPQLCTLRAFGQVHVSGNDYKETEDTICDDYSSNPSNYIYVWHNAWFMDGLGLEGATESGPNGKIAYLYSNQPLANASVPPPNWSFSSLGGSISVTRSGVGNYVVHLGKMPAGGSAQVTAFGAKIVHCTIGSIAQKAPQQIGVRCFDAKGAPLDARFTLAYTR
jgi:hypothetical protein